MRWHSPVVPLAVVAAVVIVLAATGVVPRWAGLVHAVALPPLDLGFDLRVLVARAPSWPVFSLGVAAAVGTRAVVLALVVRAFEGRSAPLRFWPAVALYAIAAPFLFLSAGLEFAGLASVYAWYAYAGIALTVVAAFTLSPVALSWAGRRGSARSRRAPVRRRRLAPVVATYLVALVLLGVVAGITSTVAAVLVLPSVGVTYGAFLWGRERLHATGASRRRTGSSRTRRRVAVVAAVLAVAALATALLWPGAGTPRDVPRRDAALLLVPGVDTASGSGALYRLDPEGIGFGCGRTFYFSYLGPGDDAPSGEAPCPLRDHRAYGRGDTQRPLEDLVDAFVAHVRAIDEQTGGAPLVVVTHSQGAWIAWSALSEGAVSGVTDLVLLAPATRSPVAYPSPRGDGEGAIGADVLRVLSAVSRRLGTSTFDPDAPLARELLADPTALERLFRRDVAPRHAVLLAAPDAPIAPEPLLVAGPVTALATTHVGITDSDDAHAAIRAVLDGASPPAVSAMWGLLQATTTAFMPPPSGA